LFHRTQGDETIPTAGNVDFALQRQHQETKRCQYRQAGRQETMGTPMMLTSLLTLLAIAVVADLYVRIRILLRR
jgi:hypothetical protein